MIYSSQYKFMYFKIPRTATRTITDGLSTKISDLIKAHKKDNHIYLDTAKTIMGPKWDAYYKFTFVRNPWDRHVSIYLFRRKRGLHRTGFGDFVKWFVKSRRNLRGENVANFYDEYITNADGSLAMDYIGKFENLQDDFNTVCKLLNIPIIHLGHVGKLQRKHYTEYYTEDWMIKAVKEAYNPKTLDYLGYKYGD